MKEIAAAAGLGTVIVDGTLQAVNADTRELTVLTAKGAVCAMAPPACVVRLNGERAKLRLLQPGDHVQVACSLVGTMLFANSVHVRWPVRDWGKDARTGADDGERRSSSQT